MDMQTVPESDHQQGRWSSLECTGHLHQDTVHLGVVGERAWSPEAVLDESKLSSAGHPGVLRPFWSGTGLIRPCSRV